jgi:uncharacterized protein (DUF433 family)
MTLPARQKSNTMNKPLVVIDPEIQSGEPVFAGTRVPVKNLFDYLQAGDSLDVFLDQFPSVSRELAVAVLRRAALGSVRNSVCEAV